jgi:hypothetical protein
MDPEKRRAAASKGGKAAHAQGMVHEFTHEEVVVAGGNAANARGTARQFTSEEARAARKAKRKGTKED